MVIVPLELMVPTQPEAALEAVKLPAVDDIVCVVAMVVLALALHAAESSLRATLGLLGLSVRYA